MRGRQSRGDHVAIARRSRGHPVCSYDLVDHVLLVDEVAGAVKKVEHRSDVARPVVKELVGSLGRRLVRVGVRVRLGLWLGSGLGLGLGLRRSSFQG